MLAPLDLDRKEHHVAGGAQVLRAGASHAIAGASQILIQRDGWLDAVDMKASGEHLLGIGAQRWPRAESQGHAARYDSDRGGRRRPCGPQGLHHERLRRQSHRPTPTVIGSSDMRAFASLIRAGAPQHPSLRLQVVRVASACRAASQRSTSAREVADASCYAHTLVVSDAAQRDVRQHAGVVELDAPRERVLQSDAIWVGALADPRRINPWASWPRRARASTRSTSWRRAAARPHGAGDPSTPWRSRQHAGTAR